MMYIGSKRRHAKRLFPYILRHHVGQPYIEPFVGGANVICEVTGGKRIGNDLDPYLIAMWRALQRGWIPPDTVSEEYYNTIKAEPDAYAPELVAFVGFLCTFGGRWFGGYARDPKGGQNFAARGRRVLLNQAPKLRDVLWLNKDYRAIEIPDRAIVYCDPPYATNNYYRTKDFCSTVFWEWARELSDRAHVLVSEYQAPADFCCLYEIPHRCTLIRSKQNAAELQRSEKLFVHESQTHTYHGIE